MSSQEKVKQSIEATAGNTAAGNFILISMVIGFASGFLSTWWMGVLLFFTGSIIAMNLYPDNDQGKTNASASKNAIGRILITVFYLAASFYLTKSLMPHKNEIKNNGNNNINQLCVKDKQKALIEIKNNNDIRWKGDNKAETYQASIDVNIQSLLCSDNLNAYIEINGKKEDIAIKGDVEKFNKDEYTVTTKKININNGFNVVRIGIFDGNNRVAEKELNIELINKEKFDLSHNTKSDPKTTESEMKKKEQYLEEEKRKCHAKANYKWENNLCNPIRWVKTLPDKEIGDMESALSCYDEIVKQKSRAKPYPLDDGDGYPWFGQIVYYGDDIEKYEFKFYWQSMITETISLSTCTVIGGRATITSDNVYKTKR